jgi:hypothetical protein
MKFHQIIRRDSFIVNRKSITLFEKGRKIMKARIFLTALLIAVFCLISTGYSQVPQMMNYQGVLTDSSGNRLNGYYNMAFSVYDTSDGGTALWTETQYEVFVDQGVFNVLLNIPDSVWSGPGDELIPRRYLGVVMGEDWEMIPRREIGSVPYAYRAAAASDNDWDIVGDVLFTHGNWGIARHGSYCIGLEDATHINLGALSTTGGHAMDYFYCTIGGGVSNIASNDFTTVGGGEQNQANGSHATVGGGKGNAASSGYATVGGGENNVASGAHASVAGGVNNSASGLCATVAGGGGGIASGNSATVGGGSGNIADGFYATVAGGWTSSASGEGATVPGGFMNTAAGDYSFAAGNEVIVDANADYTFAFGNSFTTSASHAVIFHDTQTPIKVGIGTTNPSEILHIATGMAYPDVIQIGGYTAFGQEHSSGATVVGDNVKPDDQPTMGMEIISDHLSVGGRAIKMSSADGIAFHGQTGSVTAGDPFSNELMRITNTGNVGIGTTDPKMRLHVNGNVLADHIWCGDAAEIFSLGNTGSNTEPPTSGLRRGPVMWFGGNASVKPGAIELRYGDAGSTTPIGYLDITQEKWNEIKVRVDANGDVGIGTSSPTAKLDVNGSTGYDQIRMRTSYTPTGTGDANGNVGDIAWDDDYFYVKTSAGWKRVEFSTF